jgi:hypothetical protein
VVVAAAVAFESGGKGNGRWSPRSVLDFEEEKEDCSSYDSDEKGRKKTGDHAVFDDDTASASSSSSDVDTDNDDDDDVVLCRSRGGDDTDDDEDLEPPQIVRRNVSCSDQSSSDSFSHPNHLLTAAARRLTMVDEAEGGRAFDNSDSEEEVSQFVDRGRGDVEEGASKHRGRKEAERRATTTSGLSSPYPKIYRFGKRNSERRSAIDERNPLTVRFYAQHLPLMMMNKMPRVTQRELYDKMLEAGEEFSSIMSRSNSEEEKVEYPIYSAKIGRKSSKFQAVGVINEDEVAEDDSGFEILMRVDDMSGKEKKLMDDDQTSGRFRRRSSDVENLGLSFGGTWEV